MCAGGGGGDTPGVRRERSVCCGAGAGLQRCDTPLWAGERVCVNPAAVCVCDIRTLPVERGREQCLVELSSVRHGVVGLPSPRCSPTSPV